ncbi:piggyBac transposable element-derived protein 4-like [Euwallacea similis]|uniref:piggyBac transposable element-derived protein 4-like n=1 Tax=Euwallacea similis TaxID=1736056 RepID=UPI0034504028
MRWYEEASSGEESPPDDNVNKSEDDFQENSDHESGSEQEFSSGADENPSDPDKSGEEKYKKTNFYIGKDKTTKWKNERTNLLVRIRAHNIIKLSPGPKNNARNAVSEINCIKLFLTDNIIQMITMPVNIYIEKIRNNFQKDRDARLTNQREISALIGILFLIEALRSSRKNARKIWNNSKGNSVETCYLAMSLKRFCFLMRCMRFDDITTRNYRREIDKFAPIKEVFETFVANFQNNFISNRTAFRGRCSFKQYIPSKPAKYGIKMFVLVDAKTQYTFNLEPYVGCQPEGPYKQNNSTENIVLRLVYPVERTNRNITAENWFSSVSLVKKLLTEKRLTYVGTMRKNKREIPVEFLPKKERKEYTSLFGFQDLIIVSYCSKKNKSKYLITCYNKTKIGVDLIDQMCGTYNVARTTNRWPMVIFYDLLNISNINASYVYKANHPQDKVLRSDFIKNFAWELIKPQIEYRSTINTLPRETRRRARILVGLDETLSSPPLPDLTGNRVRRCYLCPRNVNKMTRRFCQKCIKFACKVHMRDMCTAFHATNCRSKIHAPTRGLNFSH